MEYVMLHSKQGRSSDVQLSVFRLKYFIQVIFFKVIN